MLAVPLCEPSLVILSLRLTQLIVEAYGLCWSLFQLGGAPSRGLGAGGVTGGASSVVCGTGPLPSPPARAARSAVLAGFAAFGRFARCVAVRDGAGEP